jgi:hypothetical protein
MPPSSKRGSRFVAPKHRSVSTMLHDVTSQKTTIFMFFAVRIWNLTKLTWFRSWVQRASSHGSDWLLQSGCDVVRAAAAGQMLLMASTEGNWVVLSPLHNTGCTYLLAESVIQSRVDHHRESKCPAVLLTLYYSSLSSRISFSSYERKKIFVCGFDPNCV